MVYRGQPLLLLGGQRLAQYSLKVLCYVLVYAVQDNAATRLARMPGASCQSFGSNHPP